MDFKMLSFTACVWEIWLWPAPEGPKSGCSRFLLLSHVDNDVAWHTTHTSDFNGLSREERVVSQRELCPRGRVRAAGGVKSLRPDKRMSKNNQSRLSPHPVESPPPTTWLEAMLSLKTARQIVGCVTFTVKIYLNFKRCRERIRGLCAA